MRIHFTVGTLFIFLLIIFNANHALCQENPGAATSYQEIDCLLDQGHNQQALQLLKELPDDEQVLGEKLWRMARVQYEMGRVAESSDREALQYFQNAEKYARTAIATNPDQGDGYKWLAIALGAQAKESETSVQVRLSRGVKENIEEAITLAPDDDICYLVLSRWHYKVSGLGFFARTFANIVYGGLPKASLEDAEDLLWRAIGLHDRITHRYNLAKVYKRMGRRDDAILQLQQALLLPVTFQEESEELEKAKEKLQEW